MEKDEFLLRHLDLCKRVFEDMSRDGSWPWKDSQNFTDLVESEDKQDDV